MNDEKEIITEDVIAESEPRVVVSESDEGSIDPAVEIAPCEAASEEEIPEGISEEKSEGSVPEGDPSQVVSAERDSYGRRIIKPYHERAYLLYGRDESETTLDLTGTKAFLHDLGYNGGEMLQARHGRHYSENIRNAERSEGTMMYCSYCGREISGVDYYQMPDGRCRCTNCSRTLVNTKEELIGIYEKLLLNMEVFFGASIEIPIEIEMLDERKLKKKLKLSIGDVDNKSLLVLGAAVNKKKDDYSLFLENGAPRISVMATFAHELTHIWQYINWDHVNGFPNCPPEAKLIIYEGMAKWVEIQYLYLIGETAVAQREEAFTRNRKDEYGYGFCLYENRYPLTREAMICNQTPFTTDKYPID